jgi:hypothetical protein
MKKNFGLNRQLTPLECYKIYVALKAHFTSSYDFQEYKGRVKVTEINFEKRKDKKFFEVISKKYGYRDIVQIFISSYIKNGDFWVGDISSEECISTWKEWRGKIQNFHYWFAVDCEQIFEKPFKETFSIPKSFNAQSYEHPIILKMVLSKKIMIESFIVMDDLFSFSDRWGVLSGDPIWSTLSLKYKKYKPFLGHIDKKKYANIIKKVLTDSVHCDNVSSIKIISVLENIHGV